jgi:hypothetical protein
MIDSGLPMMFQKVSVSVMVNVNVNVIVRG